MAELKKYQIWLGYYEFGNGQPTPDKPLLLATVEAITFKLACLKYELSARMNFIIQIQNEGVEVEDENYEWHYDYKVNRNKYTGTYFETEEDAWVTFPKGKSVIFQP
jgi:hypothetical protein